MKSLLFALLFSICIIAPAQIQTSQRTIPSVFNWILDMAMQLNIAETDKRHNEIIMTDQSASACKSEGGCLVLSVETTKRLAEYIYRLESELNRSNKDPL